MGFTQWLLTNASSSYLHPDLETSAPTGGKTNLISVRKMSAVAPFVADILRRTTEADFLCTGLQIAAG